MVNKVVYVIHGYKAKISDHWFNYLKNNLDSEDVKVNLISLPNSNCPKYTDWLEDLNKKISIIDENTIFIAHSLGCITILNYLLKVDFSSIGGLVCVSGFYDKLNVIPELDDFIGETVKEFDYIDKIKNRMVFISDNDSYVPPELSFRLSNKLKSPYKVINNAGHFLDSDGYKEFSELLEWVKSEFLLLH